MVRLNSHYKKLNREYVFPIIEEKWVEMKKKFPNVPILNLGVGDVSLPLSLTVANAICSATQKMCNPSHIRGYGPSEGYLFLREAIVQNLYSSLAISPEEIFISDGTNSDTSNIQEIFSTNNIVGIIDPTYPVYLDTNILAGRKKNILLIPCEEKNGFCPKPPQEHCDVIYLCTPNNPTGVALSRKQLKEWIDYAKKENALLLIDSAYSAFVRSPHVPKTIYEVEGAKEVAIEFHSFSKSAGFTGLRCAYTIVPKSVHHEKIYPLWKKRQSIKSNGVSYPIQRGAEAVFSLSGSQETKSQVDAYLEEAKKLKEGLSRLGFSCFGGEDAPYVWWKTPDQMDAWKFFDLLLDKCKLISVPGTGFGKQGQGFVRLSSFITPVQTRLALRRICSLV